MNNRPTLDSTDLVQRLREQAQASGHVWVDVMLLLLEAAKEIERLRGRKTCGTYEHYWITQSGDGPIMCVKCGEHAVRYTSMAL